MEVPVGALSGATDPSAAANAACGTKQQGPQTLPLRSALSSARLATPSF